jgi:hypothetical protein
MQEGSWVWRLRHPSIVDRMIEHEPQLDATSTQHDRDMLKIAEDNE